MNRPSRTLAATLALLAALLAWDASGLDMALARLSGTAQGFALRDDWLLAVPLHDGARSAAWALALALCLMVKWPFGALARLSQPRRAQLAGTVLLTALAVSTLKLFSPTSCPWDLEAFGGTAHYLSHWSGLPDGGPGRCFPAGHAVSGFCFIGGYFALRQEQPGLAVGWLWAATAAGLVLGVAQQVRGAHFMSHTLWTGFLCWSLAYAVDRFAWVRRPWLA